MTARKKATLPPAPRKPARTPNRRRAPKRAAARTPLQRLQGLTVPAWVFGAAARRGLGLVLGVVGVALALALFSYHASDPSPWRAVAGPVRNWLGPFGAAAAEGLRRSLGVIAPVLPLVLLVWAARLTLGRMPGQGVWRALALPLGVLALAAFASGFPPDGMIGHGGLTGDRVIMGGAAVFAGFGLPLPYLWAGLLALGVAVLALGFALGLTREDMRAGAGWLLSGNRALLQSGGAVASQASRVAASRAREQAAKLSEARAARAAARAAPENPPVPVFGAPPAFATAPPPPAPDDGADIPGFLRKKAQVGASPAAAPLPAPAPMASEPAAPPPLAPRAPTPDAPRPVSRAWQSPGLDLLRPAPPQTQEKGLMERLGQEADDLERVLGEYSIRGVVNNPKPGPVVTLFDLEPAPGLKAARVVALADDIARSMSKISARVSTVPGRNVIGIELPNRVRETVYLRSLFENPAFTDAPDPLTLALGEDISGAPVCANLAKMPHLLIAGTTGSGKSVAINTMILSLLYRLSPQDCRMIMIDPKMLELSVYDRIPHLLAPVVIDPKKAVGALKWVVAEMERRYQLMSQVGVRNIDGWNARVREARMAGEVFFTREAHTGFDEATGQPIYEDATYEAEHMPLIVVVVDEMADLMMVAGKEIEACIQRLAQMARASGIHLIMATQRPSVDVITGTIKANFPTRISFQVTSKIDSRTILGEQGAEQLLGQGDMLYMEGGGRIRRVHGPFVSDREVEDVVTHLRSLGPPNYREEVIAAFEAVDEPGGGGGGGGDEGDDPMYEEAVAVVLRDQKASTSHIQRKLAIGYNRAARIVDMMETRGVVSPADHVGRREILGAGIPGAGP